MHEIRRRPRIDQIYSEGLSRLTGISPGRWMMFSNHPELGGGFIFSLGHLSNRDTCVLVNKTGRHLWEVDSWCKTTDEKIIKWAKKTLNSTKSSLRIPASQEILNAMFNH